MHLLRLVALGALLAALSACTTVRLADHQTPFNVAKQRRAAEGVAAVLPFAFEPANPDYEGRMTAADLARWNKLFTEALDRTNIFAEVVEAAPIDDLAFYQGGQWPGRARRGHTGR